MRIMKTGTPNASRRAAFTLMEVLVVVAILVVLAGVGGVIFLRVQEDQYKKLAATQCKALSDAAQSYASSHGDDLPESLQDLISPPDGGRSYIEVKATIDPWNRPYQYLKEGQRNVGNGKPDIWSQGPNLNDSAGQVGNW